MKGEKLMKGDKQLKAKLNQALKFLLTGINQYFLHARMCEDWGFDTLGKKDYGYSISLMKSADKLIKRILFLEGLPNLQDLGKLYIGVDVEEVLSGNLKFEYELQQALATLIVDLENGKDFISRECVEHILAKCEEQIDWLEAQQDLLNKLGKNNYLQSAV